MAGVEPDPNLKCGVAQARDAPDQFDRRVAGQRRVIVVRDRGAEHGREPVAQFLADDAPELTHRAPHRGQGRLQPRDRLLRIELGNQPGRINDVGAEDRHEPAFAVRLGTPHGHPAFGAPAIAGSIVD